MAGSPLFHNIATRRSPGTASLSNSRRLAERSVALSESPVTLPPGCATLNKPSRNRIAEARGGNGGSAGLTPGKGCRVAPSHDHINLRSDQVAGELTQLVLLPHGSATVKGHVAAEGVSVLG